nr:Zgc:154040 [Danio rerio]AAI64279.1 Zgc:154040 protein [Danio rerio]
MNKFDKKPQPGDLIEIFRGIYQHWAIYVGDGYVIHLVPPSEHAHAGANSMMSVLHERAKVKKENLYEVVGDHDYRINNFLDDKYEPRPIHEILQDAYSVLGQERSYSVFSGNFALCYRAEIRKGSLSTGAKSSGDGCCCRN